MKESEKQLWIIKGFLVVFIFFGIAPNIIKPKFIKTEIILVFEVEVREKFNIVQVDYSRTKQWSINGELVYVQVGRRRIAVFDGVFYFEVGGVYELTYTPIIQHYNVRPKIRTVKVISN